MGWERGRNIQAVKMRERDRAPGADARVGALNLIDTTVTTAWPEGTDWCDAAISTCRATRSRSPGPGYRYSGGNDMWWVVAGNCRLSIRYRASS